MTGCASLKGQSTLVTPRCEPIAKDGKYKTFGEVTEKLIDLIDQYSECAANHNKMVDFYEGKQ